MRFSPPFVNYFGGLGLEEGLVFAPDFGLAPAPVNMPLVKIKITLKIIDIP